MDRRLQSGCYAPGLNGQLLDQRDQCRHADRLQVHRGHTVLLVDEAQQLSRECIEFLRYLHDHRLTRFALLLVGDDAWQVLAREPMLRSRIYRWCSGR